jgi:hypothetical protein
MNVSFGDSLEWGEGDGCWSSAAKIMRAVARWKERYGVTSIYWRGTHRFWQRYGRVHYGPTARPAHWQSETRRLASEMDDFETILTCGHTFGLRVYLYLTLFDEGWPLGPDGQCSFGPMGADNAPQSLFTVEHPEYLENDRLQHTYHHGVLCYAYPEARAYRLRVLGELLGNYDFDGLFLCTRSQSQPAAHADQFGFNAPIVDEFEQRYGVNILRQDFSLGNWRRLRGAHLTQLLREIRELTNRRGMRLSIGVPRGSYLGPPVGNLYLDWHSWVEERLVDALCIDQVASVCPSTWFRMWPGQSGYGYMCNHLAGIGMNDLLHDVQDVYGPICTERGCELYLSRMHHAPVLPDEAILASPCVSGLVLNAFRLDNPEVCIREPWLHAV